MPSIRHLEYLVRDAAAVPLSPRAPWAATLAIAALLGLATGAGHCATLEEQQQFADGLYARGLYELALREYMAILRVAPQYSALDQVLYRVGECYRERGNVAAADLFYRRVIAEHPNSPFRARAELRRAELFLGERRPAEAIQMLRELVARAPPPEIEAGAHYYIGIAARMTNGLADAEAELRQVLERFAKTPFHPLAAMELADLRQRAGAPLDEVAQLYREAAVHAASSNLAAEAWQRLGNAAYAATNYPLAAEAYGRLLQDHPGHPRAAEASLPAAWSLYHVGRPADALALAEREIAARGETEEWLYLAANARRALLDTDRAVDTYDALARRFPASRLAAAARFESAQALFRQRRYVEVIRRLDRADWEPDLRAEVDWMLAESYAQTGSPETAIQHYRRVVEAQPPSPRAPEAMYRLGTMLVERGARAEASELLRAMVARYPDHPMAPAALLTSGFAHAADERWEEAIVDWGRVERSWTNSPHAEEALFQKGLAELRLKRHAAATASLQALLRRFPSTERAAEANYWLAVLADQSGETAEAENRLRRVLELDPSPDLRRNARFLLARTLQKLRRDAEAADLWQELLATPSRAEMPPDLLEWLALFRLEHRAYSNALAVAETLLAGAPDDAWRQIGAHLLGRAREGLGDTTGALAAFEQADRGAPVTRARVEALLAAARLRLAAGETERAEHAARRAAEFASDDRLAELKARALRLLGEIAEARRDLPSAARYYLSVAILYDHPELSPECLWRAAAHLATLGDTNEAARLRAELRQRYPDSSYAKQR
ncbi:MAG: tetratricopeptide repeat protein [Kiritimatiellae bacterium]|nr:tetratricopeptide repeat protein [Kiritimatiellia bacterium]